MDKIILKKFLKAGYIERGCWHPNEQGVPQGGVLSPTLARMVLTGLETKSLKLFKKNSKVHVGVYADDFIVSGASQELLERLVKPVIVKFLKERGLELSQQKTKITPLEKGFDFLGFHIRKNKNGKLLIQPAKSKIKEFLKEIRKLIKANTVAKTENLIRLLNPKIRGWANYYRHVSAAKAFSYIDKQIYLALDRWIKKRHPKKSKRWMKTKYFRYRSLSAWQFFTKIKEKVNLKS